MGTHRPSLSSPRLSPATHRSPPPRLRPSSSLVWPWTWRRRPRRQARPRALRPCAKKAKRGGKERLSVRKGKKRVGAARDAAPMSYLVVVAARRRRLGRFVVAGHCCLRTRLGFRKAEGRVGCGSARLGLSRCGRGCARLLQSRVPGRLWQCSARLQCQVVVAKGRLGFCKAELAVAVLSPLVSLWICTILFSSAN